MTPTVLCGVDGCKAGWVCVSMDTCTREITASIFDSMESVVDQDPRPAVLAIDVPIGLPDAGARACDVEARRLLGTPRRSSVFPSPIRPALGAETRDEASVLTSEVDGRRVSAQGWGIYRKVREVDDFMRRDPDLQEWVREVHPEVSFWQWNGGAPMEHRKKGRDGFEERLDLIEAHFGNEVFEVLRSQVAKPLAANDDILDALAALWSAERVHSGSARTLPEEPTRDSAGLRMEIIY